jgi:hypothetical protein
MRKFKSILLLFLTVFLLVGCGVSENNQEISNNNINSESDEVGIAFQADFYTNDGELWFQTFGESLDMKSNRMKQFGYSTEGFWTSWYETSSIISMYIDGNQIDSCGSTVIFSDINLKPCDINFYANPNKGEQTNDSSIAGDLLMSYAKIKLWWLKYKDTHGDVPNSKLVVVQSQTGKPIAMYMGEQVTWQISSLPKTTEVIIDGRTLLIHRANFSVIDTNMIHIEENISGEISTEVLE